MKKSRDNHLNQPNTQTDCGTLPSWISDVMQGLCYWIGYRRTYYRHHKLVEGAITAELSNLINSKINHDQYIHCEALYKNLGLRFPSGMARNFRLDLLITKSNEKNIKLFDGDVAIEVKRGVAPKKEILEDLRWLLMLKRANRNLRTYLLIVSEGEPPKQFEWFSKKSDGKIELKASRKVFKFDGIKPSTKGKCKVRRVCKAIASTKPKQSHTAVLIEVF